MQAITVRFVGPTDKRDARLRVKAQAGVKYYPYHDGRESYSDKCINAAQQYAAGLGWYGEWHCGTLPGGDDVVFVQVDGTYSEGFKVCNPSGHARWVRDENGKIDTRGG